MYINKSRKSQDITRYHHHVRGRSTQPGANFIGRMSHPSPALIQQKLEVCYDGDRWVIDG